MAPSRFPAFRGSFNPPAAWIVKRGPLSPTPGLLWAGAEPGRAVSREDWGDPVDLEGGSDPGPELSSENKAKALAVTAAQPRGGPATHIIPRHHHGDRGAAVSPNPWLVLRYDSELKEH